MRHRGAHTSPQTGDGESKGGTQFPLSVCQSPAPNTVSSRIFSENVGYIRIDSFSGASAAQFDTALAEVRAAGVTSLVIDLRNNTGGSIEAMANIVDTLAPEGEIVKAVYNSGVEKVLHRSTEGEVFLPIVILQNGYTASSSEVMIAALQDYDKVLTVGTTSYGKFVMQEIHQFTDGSAVKLTTAQLFSPNGNSFNGSGITPENAVKFKRVRTPEGVRDLAYPDYIGLPFDPANDPYPYPPEAQALTYDGLHPSDEGNERLAALVADALERLL